MKISEYIIKHIINYTKVGDNVFLFNGSKIGVHKGIGWGFSTEFSEYRPYIEGEDIRFLDWKHYALTGKKYQKVFTRETNTNVYILLDISSSMSFYRNIDGLHISSLLTAVVSYVFYKMGDKVTVYFFNDDIIKSFEIKNSFARLKELWSVLDDLHFNGETNIGRVIKKIVPSFNTKGYVILISDFYTDIENLKTGINYLLPKNFYSISMYIYDNNDVNINSGNVKLVGLEGGDIEVDGWEYSMIAQKLKSHRETEVISLLENMGVFVYKVSSNTELKEFLHYFFADIV